MSWQNTGVFATPQGPPGASGVPQMQPGQQTMPSQQNYQGGYSPDHLPPPPGQQPQQGGYAPPPQPYGVQPGVPGTQFAQPLSTQQPGQQWGTPAQAPQQPQQQWPQGQPAQQNPQGQPQQQWPQGQPAQQQGRVQLDDNTILDGAGVPPELRGRTWADARRLYSALSTDWLQRNSRQQTPAQQSLQQQGFGQQPQGQQFAPQGQQPFQGQQPGQQPAQDPRQFWQNPQQHIGDIVGQAIEQRLGPVLQRNQQTAILEARNIAQTGIQDFGYLEPDIMQIVSGARPEDLQNPQVWIAAARMARGQRMEAGQYQPQTTQQRQPQIPGQNGNGNGGGYGPGYAQPAYNAPPVNQFFSESPSAPNVGGYGGPQGSGKQATQEDYHYAQKWQMPIQDFMAWKYGAQPQPVGSF